MGFLGDIVDSVTSLPHTAASAVTGKHGVLGSKGVLGNVLKGNVKGALVASGSAVGQVAGNHLIQASFGNIAIPAAVLSGAVKGGKNGALNAVKNAADNPVTKAELAALAVILPPLAPASAAGIAAMEATSRLVDAVKSKDPKKVAQAAMVLGGTALKARSGDPGAQRAVTLLEQTSDAYDIVTRGDKSAVAKLEQLAKHGDKRAADLLKSIDHQTLRHALKISHGTVPAKPALKAKARELVAQAQLTAPGRLAGTLAALNSPHGVRIGEFALLRTGRILHKGRPVRIALKASHNAPTKRTPKRPPTHAARRLR